MSNVSFCHAFLDWIGDPKSSVSHNLGTTIVIINSTANLTCKAVDPGSPAAVYRWRRPNDADFEQATRSVLTIYEAKLSDSGVYSCLPFNVIDKGEIGSYNLTVYDPATLENRLNLEDTVTENETINYSLTCTARGFPVPNITWYKDGGIVLESDHWAVVNELSSNIICQFREYCAQQIRSTLSWKDNVRWSDKGVFSCGAHNGAGDMEKSSILLRVFHKPVVVNDPSRPFVAADVGKSAEIHCRTTSMPEPTFTWFKNGESLPSTFDYTISSRRQNHSVPDLHESFLSIRRLTESDMGDYLCKATNKFGSGSFIFTIQGRTKPTAPSEFQTLQITHHWIALQWKPGFDGGSDQIFTVEVVYPWNTPVHYIDIPETLRDFRHKRYARIETAAYNILNVTSAAEIYSHSLVHCLIGWSALNKG
uniref:Ig-like domain-containing protein n=1 Tax=Romanomermis culicivorax TaxID=13658 RepID=A0A915IEF6_ROMCU